MREALGLQGAGAGFNRGHQARQEGIARQAGRDRIEKLDHRRAGKLHPLILRPAQAGIGDKVLLVIEGRAAGHAVRRRAAPIDAAIVGVIDSVTRYESD